MSRYRLSFTFGGLLIHETQLIADSYLRLGDWQRVRDEVIHENLMGKPRREGSSRYLREIRDRLKHAYSWEVPIISGQEGSPYEARLALYAATIRYYRIVWDFVVEVVRYKTAGGDFQMIGFEFESFWERKGESAAEMHEITETSRKKLVQVAYRMLREAGILPEGREGRIVPPVVPYSLLTRYANEHDRDTLLAFLLADCEIKTLLSDGRN